MQCLRNRMFEISLYICSPTRKRNSGSTSPSVDALHSCVLRTDISYSEQAQHPTCSRSHDPRNPPVNSRRTSTLPCRQYALLPRSVSCHRRIRGIYLPTPHLPIAVLPRLSDESARREEQDAQLLSSIHDMSIDGQREDSAGKGKERECVAFESFKDLTC